MCGEGSTMGLAPLAKLLSVTLLRDSISWALGCLALRVFLGLRWGCTALSFSLEVRILLLYHDLLDSL